MTLELKDAMMLAEHGIPTEYIYAAFVVASGYGIHASAGTRVPKGYRPIAFRLPRDGEKFLTPSGEVREPYTGWDPGVYEPRFILEKIG